MTAAAACARCETALEHGDLRCAICGLPAPMAPTPATSTVDRPSDRPSGRVPAAQILRCGECNAAVAFVAEARAPRCGFCGATMAIEQPIDPIETARHGISFTVDRAAAEAAVRSWLARRGWLAPRMLSREAVLESLVPLSWAAWRVNARARVAWTADSDAGAERSAWAPHAGECWLDFHDIVVPATRGLGARECRRLIPHYALADLAAIDSASGPPSEAGRAAETTDAPDIVERFDLQRSAARAHVQDAITAAARLRVEPHIPGRRRRNIRVACLVERQTSDRIALPAWVLAYRYRGRPYRAIVHGQRADVAIGTAPIDWAKLARLGAVIAALAAVIAVIALGAR